MKLHVLTENLQKKLSLLNRAVSSRTQLPILNNILIETEGGRLKMSTTDLEIGIVVEIPANIEKEGATTVPARIFSELISSLPQEKITLEIIGNNLIVFTKKTKSSIQTINREDFPKIYEDKGEEMIVVKTKDLYEDLIKVVFAVSVDMARPALSGVLLKEEDKGFLIVATDGYRLSLKHHVVLGGKKEQINTQEKPLLIPGRIMREFISSKTDEEETTLYVSNKNNQILFSQKNSTIVGRLIEAEFPNYERIIPTDFATRVLFDRREMQQAVKTCSIFARETGNIIKINTKKDKIIISANTPSVGDNTVEVEGAVSGQENEIAFNARYMLELFSNIEDETMVFEMMNPLSPGVFKIEKDLSFLHIIMPIRVQPEQ